MIEEDPADNNWIKDIMSEEEVEELMFVSDEITFLADTEMVSFSHSLSFSDVLVIIKHWDNLHGNDDIAIDKAVDFFDGYTEFFCGFLIDRLEDLGVDWRKMILDEE